jgi:hypothetical protein
MVRAVIDTYRYARRGLRTDLLRACAGLVLTLAPLAVAHDSQVAEIILGGLAGLFMVFALRTGLRYLTLVEVTGDGISWAPVGARSLCVPRLRPVRLSWGDIDKVSLRFFSTKRDRSEGWMELSLSAGRRGVTLDSTLDGFRAIAERCAQAAAENNIRLSSSTVENFRSLGIATMNERY